MAAVRRRGPQSPRLARALLRHLLPAREREFLIGDLEESFEAKLNDGVKPGPARRWYWRAALASIAALREREEDWQPRHQPQPQRPKGDSVMKNILRDIKQGVRLLGRAPGFTAVAVLTLALGIGANSAIFTVTYAILLKPLPYSNPDELVLVSENNLSRGWTSFTASPANFIDFRDQNKSFARFAAYRATSFNYSGNAVSGGAPERLRGLSGTEGFLEMLDGTPAVGRGFSPEHFTPGNDKFVILGHAFWVREFGGRDSILNQTITLNGVPYVVVGVMHPNWRFGGRDIAAFTPRTLSQDERQSRGGHFLNIVGRLKSGVSLDSARTDLAAIAARLETQYPDTNKGWGTVANSLLDAAVGGFRPTLAILLGAVGLVLLVACANLANMHLARATGRAREMAIRAAIGAGRLRIVQQLLTENLVLSAIGGSIGLLIAYWSTSAFIKAYPTLLPRSGDIRVDGRVIAFTAGVAVLTSILFGLAPAIAAARIRFTDTLKDGARGGGGRLRGLMRNGLVVAEVALALVLLAGGGLLLKSFAQLARVDPGFQTDHRLTALTILPRPKYADSAPTIDFYDRATAGLQAEPGVEAVALTSIVPMSGGDEIYSLDFEGRPPLAPGQGVSAIYYVVSSNYFDTMGIRVLKGRGFTDTDRDGAPRVMVINQAFADLHFPNEDPIGKRVRIGRNASIAREIVGVVANTKHYGLRDDEKAAQMYEPFRQFPSTSMTMVIKTTGEPTDSIPAVRRQIQNADPNQPVATTASLDQILSDSGALPRVQATLMGSLGAIALVLAAVGLYGVMAYSVSQRTQEIGIRMTLGAHHGSVLRMVLLQAMTLTLVGLVIGLGGAIALGRLLSTVLEPMLFKVTPTDAATLMVVAVVLSTVALLAALVPARRATRIDPIQALRSW
ncbi:MAG TPA: ABC transporter permease [Vicinamibacterales bacterium]|nr:ABC transporter permease [Vicinamibacterales bacterium]